MVLNRRILKKYNPRVQAYSFTMMLKDFWGLSEATTVTTNDFGYSQLQLMNFKSRESTSDIRLF